jgi:hypothetical protein
MKAVQNRQHERCGLARTRHCRGQDIASGHRGWYGITLNGCRLGESHIRHTTQQIGMKVKLIE